MFMFWIGIGVLSPGPDSPGTRQVPTRARAERAEHAQSGCATLEAEPHAKILLEDGQERCRRVMWEAAWAKRQREMDIWETRCRVALLQVYWERVEEMGRWAVGALQWKLNKVILRQHQWNWDRGWLQFWAQEEAATVGKRGGPGARNRLLAC